MAFTRFCAWSRPLTQALGATLLLASSVAAAPLGICRQEAARGDGYMQLLCEGETALDEQQPRAAIEHFFAAAALPRRSASNELAWAGLAAAHCRAGDTRSGRDWAQRFGAARRIWIGETPCALDSGAPNPKVPHEVHRDLCADSFVADYALIRANPQSTVAQDIRTRLDGVQKSVEAACGSNATQAAAPASQKTAAPAAPAAKTQKKRKRRASGTAASPGPGK
jgi:hypothetical protein